MQQQQTALDRRLVELENLNREIGGLEAEVERLRGLQQSREKERVALDHEMRKVNEDRSRANSRVSVAQLELDRLRPTYVLDQILLGTDPDPEGGDVLTYNGWPLYTYTGDVQPAQATGQAIDLNGGEWYVLRPTGKPFIPTP